MRQDNWDDGSPVDRRAGSSRNQSKKKLAARDAAVARQAERVVMVELLGLPGVVGVEVVPRPDAMRLAVTVTVSPGDLVVVREALMARGGALRHAVAAALRRRKAPELFFEFALAETGRGHE